MRCKRHPTDLSSSVGVCATCLRERLFAVIAAQAQAQQQARFAQQVHPRASATRADELHRKSDADLQPPPALLFPRSVSPNIARRKSDNINTVWDNHFDLHIYSTPQVGPTYNSVTGSAAITTTRSFAKNFGRFALLSNLFRSRSDKCYSDHSKNLDTRDSRETSSSSSSWFSNIFSIRRKKKSRFSAEYSSDIRVRVPRKTIDRGMSPVGEPETDCEDCDACPSGNGDWSDARRTPIGGPSMVRRGKPGHGRNVSSGLVFCLSPLVRASPNRQWNQKGGLPPDLGYSGEVRVQVNPHISNAATHCANRSRKLADFGRVNHNR